MSLEIDVSYLTPDERETILRVLKRDEIIRNTDHTRVKRLRRKSESASYRDKLQSRIFTGEWFDQLTAPGRRVIKNISEALQKVIMIKTTTVTTTEMIVRDRAARGAGAATDTETSTRTTDVSGEESRALNFESHSVTRTDSAVAVVADGNRNTREIFHESERTLTVDGTHPTDGLHTTENASRRPRPRPGTASGSVNLRSRSRDEESVHARLESHGRRPAGSEISTIEQSGNTDCQSQEIPHFTDLSVNENKGTTMVPGAGTERTSHTEDGQAIQLGGESETYDSNDLIDVGTDEIIGPDYDKNQVGQKDDIVDWMSDNLTEAMRDVVAAKNAQQNQPVIEEIVIPLNASSLQEVPMRNAVDIDKVKEELSSRISDSLTELEASHSQDLVKSHGDVANMPFEPIIVPAKRMDNDTSSHDAIILALEEENLDKIDEMSGGEDHKPSGTSDSTVERNSEFGVNPDKRCSRKLSRQSQVVTEDTIVPITTSSLNESPEKDEIDMETAKDSLSSRISETLEEVKTFDTQVAHSNDTKLGIISGEPHIVPVEIIDRLSSKEDEILAFEEGNETKVEVDSNVQEYQVTDTSLLQGATGTAETENEFGVEHKESSSKGTSTHSLQSSNNEHHDDVAEQVTVEVHAQIRLHHTVTPIEDVDKSSQLATSPLATIELPDIDGDVSDNLDLPANAIGQLSSGSDDGSVGDEKLSLLQFLESLPTIKPTDSPARHTSPISLPTKICREISMDSITSTDAVITLLDDMMTKVEDIMVEVDDYNEAYANEDIATGNISSGKVYDVKFETSEPMTLVETESYESNTRVDENETQLTAVESRTKLIKEETDDDDDRHPNIEGNKKFDDKSVIEVKEEEDVIIPTNVSDMTASTNVIADQGEGNNEIVGTQEIDQQNEFQADENQTYQLQTRNDILQSEIHLETKPPDFSVDASTKSDNVSHKDPPSSESSEHINDDSSLESNRAGTDEEESMHIQNEDQNPHYEVSHETDIVDTQELMYTSTTEPLTLSNDASTTQDVDETAGIVANKHKYIENTVNEGGDESDSNDGSGAPFELEDIPSSNGSSCSETSNQLNSYIKYSDVENTPDIELTYSVNTTKIPTISVTDYDEERSEMTLAKFVEENDGSDSDIYISDADEVVYHRESSYSLDISEGSDTSDEYFVENSFSGSDAIQTSEFHSLPENEDSLTDLNAKLAETGEGNVEIYEVASSQAYAREPYKTDESEIVVTLAYSSQADEKNSAIHADTGTDHSDNDEGDQTISSLEVTEENEDDAHYHCYDVDIDEGFEIGHDIRSSVTESPSNIERNLYPIVEESEHEDDLHSDNSTDRAPSSAKDVTTQNEDSSIDGTFAELDQSNAVNISIDLTAEMKPNLAISNDEIICDPVVHATQSTATNSSEYEENVKSISVDQKPAVVGETVISRSPEETKQPTTDSDGTQELEKGMSSVENSPQPGECIRESMESYDETNQIRSTSSLAIDELPAVSPVSAKMMSVSDVENESVGQQIKGDSTTDGDTEISLDKTDKIGESTDNEVDEKTVCDDAIELRGIATTENIDDENGIEKTRPKIIKKSLKRKTVKRKTGKSSDGKADVLKKSTKKKVLKKIRKSPADKQDDETSPVEPDELARFDIKLDDKQLMDNQNETLSLETNLETEQGHAMEYTTPLESPPLQDHSQHLEGGMGNENVQFLYEETESKSSSQIEIEGPGPQDSNIKNISDSMPSEVAEPSEKDNFDAEQQPAFPTNLGKELIDDQQNIVIGPTMNVETYVEDEILGEEAPEMLGVNTADDTMSLDEESNITQVSDQTGATKMLSFDESIEKVELYDICPPIVSDLLDETHSLCTPQIEENITGESKSKEYVDDKEITFTEMLDKPSDDDHIFVYLEQSNTSNDVDKHEYQDSSHDTEASSEINLKSAGDTSAIVESRVTPGIEILQPSTEGNDVTVCSLNQNLQVEEHTLNVSKQSTSESPADIPTDENTSKIDTNYSPSRIGEPIQDFTEPIRDEDAFTVAKPGDNRALNELIHEKIDEFVEETNIFVDELSVQIDTDATLVPDNQEAAIELSADPMLRADETVTSIDESTEKIGVNALAQQTDIASEENQTSHIQMLDRETGAGVQKIDTNIESVETEIEFVSTKYLVEEGSSVGKGDDNEKFNENEGDVTDTPSDKTADQEHYKADEQHFIDGEYVPTPSEVVSTTDLSLAFDNSVNNIEESVPERTKADDEISVQMIAGRVDTDFGAKVAATGSSFASEITTQDTTQTLFDEIHGQWAEEDKSTALFGYDDCTAATETPPAGDLTSPEACVDDTHQENDPSTQMDDGIISERIIDSESQHHRGDQESVSHATSAESILAIDEVQNSQNTSHAEVFEMRDMVKDDKLVASHDSESKDIVVGDKPIALMNQTGIPVETQKDAVAKESTEGLVVETEPFNIDVANEDCRGKEISNEEFHSNTVVTEMHDIGHEGIETSPTSESEIPVIAENSDAITLLDTAPVQTGDVDSMHEWTPEKCDPVHASGLHTEKDISSAEDRNLNAMPSQSIDEMKGVTAAEEHDGAKENSSANAETIVDRSFQSIVTDAAEIAETSHSITKTDNTVDINEENIETFIKESSPLVVKKSVRRKTIKKKGQKSRDETTDVPKKSTKKKVVKVIKKSTASENEVNISLEHTESVQEAASSEAVVDDEHRSEHHQPKLGKTSQEPIAIDDAANVLATSPFSETKTEPPYEKFEQDSSTSEFQSTIDIQDTAEEELDTGFDIDKDVTASGSEICSSHDQNLDISAMPDADFTAENIDQSIQSNSESSRKKTHRVTVRKKKSHTDEEQNVKQKSVRIKAVKRPLEVGPESTPQDEAAASSGVGNLSHDEGGYAMKQSDLSTTVTEETNILPDISRPTSVDETSYDEGSKSASVEVVTPTKVEEEDVETGSLNTGDNELIENDNKNVAHDTSSKDGAKLIKKKTIKKKKARIDSKQKSPKKVIKRKIIQSGQAISLESAPSFPEDQDQPLLDIDGSSDHLPTYGNFDQSLEEKNLTAGTDIALNATSTPENEVAEMLIGEIINHVLSECQQSYDEIDTSAVMETLQPSIDESNGNIHVDGETLTDGNDKLVEENSQFNPTGHDTMIDVSNSEQPSVSETSDASEFVSEFTSIPRLATSVAAVDTSYPMTGDALPQSSHASQDFVSDEANHVYEREAVQPLIAKSTSEGEITDRAQTATEDEPQSVAENVEALADETVNFLTAVVGQSAVSEILDAVVLDSRIIADRITSPEAGALATEGGTDDSFLVEPNHQFDTLDVEAFQSSGAQSTNEDQDDEESQLAEEVLVENIDIKVLTEPEVDTVLGQASESAPEPTQVDRQLASEASGLDSELEAGLIDTYAKDSDHPPISATQKLLEDNEDLKPEPDHTSSTQSVWDPLDTVEAVVEPSSNIDKTSAPEESNLEPELEIAKSLAVECIDESGDENQKTANSALDSGKIPQAGQEHMTVTNELAYEIDDTFIDSVRAEQPETSRIESATLDESRSSENLASVGVGEISNLSKTENTDHTTVDEEPSIPAKDFQAPENGSLIALSNEPLKLDEKQTSDNEMENTESSACQSADQPVLVESKKDSKYSELVESTDHDTPDDQSTVTITVSEPGEFTKKKIGGRIYVKKTRRSRRRSAVEKRAIGVTDSPDGSQRHSSDEYFSNDSMLESSDDDHVKKETSLEEQHHVESSLPSDDTQDLPLKSESADLPNVSVGDSQQDASESVGESVEKIPFGDNEENNLIHESVVGAEPCENLLVDSYKADDTEKEEKDDTVHSKLSVESEISAEPISDSKEFENDAASSSKAKNILVRKTTRKKKNVETSTAESGGKSKKKIIRKIQQRENHDTTSQEIVETSLNEEADKVPDFTSDIEHPAVPDIDELQHVSANVKSDFSVENSKTAATELDEKDGIELASDIKDLDRTDEDDSAASATKQSQQNNDPPTAVPRWVVKKTIRKKKGNSETSSSSKKSVKKVVKMLPQKTDPIDLQVQTADAEETSEDIRCEKTVEFTSQDQHDERANEGLSTDIQAEGNSTKDESPSERSFHRITTENSSTDNEPDHTEADEQEVSEVCESISVRQPSELSDPNVTERYPIDENISSDEPSKLPAQDTAAKEIKNPIYEDVTSETIDTEDPVHIAADVLKESGPTEIDNMQSDETMEKTIKPAGAEGFEAENLIAEETFEIHSKDSPTDTCKGAISESVAIKSDIAADVNQDAFVNASSDGNEYRDSIGANIESVDIDSTNINETLNKDDVFMDAVSHEVSQDVISDGGAMQHESIPIESAITDETVGANDTDLFMDAMSDEQQGSQEFIADGLATQNESVGIKDETLGKSDPDEFTATVSDKNPISDDAPRVQNEPNPGEFAIADEALSENDPDMSVDTLSGEIRISADILSNVDSSTSPSTEPPQNESPDSSILKREEEVSPHLVEFDNDSTKDTESQNLNSPVTAKKSIRKVIKAKKPKTEPDEDGDTATSQTKSVRKKVIRKKKNQTPSDDAGAESSNITIEASTESINTAVLHEGLDQTVDSIPPVTASTEKTSQENASVAVKPKVVKRVKKSAKKPQKVEADDEKDESSRKPTVKRKTIKKVQKS